MRLTKRQAEVLRILNSNSKNDIVKAKWMRTYQVHSVDKPKSIFNYSLMGSGRYIFSINPETFNNIKDCLCLKSYDQNKPLSMIYQISDKGKQYLESLEEKSK
jgi:hypothetical protein